MTWKENAHATWATAAVAIAIVIMLGWSPNCASHKQANDAAANDRSKAKEGS